MKADKGTPLLLMEMGVSQNYGYLFGGSNRKGYSILGSILGSLYFGKLPNKPSYQHKQYWLPDDRDIVLNCNKCLYQ